MNFEVYRGWFIVGSLVLMLAAASPTLAIFIHLPNSWEKFSELWLLGPGHKAEDYPFNVRLNQSYGVYVAVTNHLGYSVYYRVDVKFRNQTQPLPNSRNLTPSPLNSTYEFQFFLADGKTWEAKLIFSLHGKPMFINNVSMNGNVFPVNCSSMWSQGDKGFYYQLFLELWLYDTALQSFQYHNRFVGIWLNITV